jgi:hypothetical protein
MLQVHEPTQGLVPELGDMFFGLQLMENMV